MQGFIFKKWKMSWGQVSKAGDKCLKHFSPITKYCRCCILSFLLTLTQWNFLVILYPFTFCFEMYVCSSQKLSVSFHWVLEVEINHSFVTRVPLVLTSTYWDQYLFGLDDGLTLYYIIHLSLTSNINKGKP